MSKQSNMLIGIVILIVTGLACSFASSTTATPQSLPEQNTPPVAATFPPVASPPQATAEANTPEPAGDTATPTATMTSIPNTPKPANTKKPVASPEPLQARYERVGIRREPNNQAVLTLRVIATGGGGGYKYYNDNVQQPGDTFDVLGTCGAPLTHTIKVTSADGESVSIQYFEAGNCPTPTPTATP
jgi:hypothetical protein